MKTLVTRASAGVLVVAAAGVLLIGSPNERDTHRTGGTGSSMLSGKSLDPDSAFFRGDFETAAALYRVLALAGRQRAPGRHAELGVVRSLLALGRFDEAERYARQLDDDSTRTLPAIDAALLVCLRAEIFTRRAEIPVAVEYAADCRKRIRPHSQTDAVVRWYALYVNAFAQAEADEFDVALGYYLDALAVLEEADLERSAEYARTINHVANVHYRTGSFRLARRLHEQALTLRETLFVEHHPDLAASYGNIGNVLHAMGDFESALEHHRRALSIWTRSLGPGHPQTAYSLNNIGYALNRLERYEEAEYYLLRAAELKARVLSRGSLSLARTHRNLADAYLGQGNAHLAARYADHALDAVAGSGHQNDILAAQARVTRARILRYEGRDDEAELELNHALSAAFDQNHPYAVVVLNDLARLHLETGDASTAVDLTDRAVAFGSGPPRRVTRAGTPRFGSDRETAAMRASHPVIGTSHQLRAAARLELFRTTGDPAMLESSLSDVRRAIDTLDDSPLVRSDLTMSDYHIELLERFARTGLHAARAAWQCGCVDDPIRDALTFSNILKTGFDYTERLITDHLDTAEAPALLDSLELELFETRRRRAVLELDYAATPRRAAQLERRIFELGRRIRTARGAFQLADVPGILSVYDPGPLEQAALPNDALIVDYVLLADRILSIAVSPSGGFMHETVRSAKLDALFETYPQTVRAADVVLYTRHARALHEALMAPLGLEADTRRLVISPHDILWDIPFETLLTDDPPAAIPPSSVRFSELDYVIEDHAISYTLTAASFMKRSRAGAMRPPREARRILAVAPGFGFEHALSDPVREFLSLHGYTHVEAERSTPLSGSVREVARMTGISGETTILTDGYATESSFVFEINKRHNIIHIATHGYASSRAPTYAGILLSPEDSPRYDGVMYAKEMKHKRISTGLLTVSACYSGYTGGGENAESRFIHALSSPGINNVILALWPIPDASSSEMITDMYSHVNDRYATEYALQYAKIKAIDSASPTAHPSVWAPFVHVANSLYGVPVL